MKLLLTLLFSAFLWAGPLYANSKTSGIAIQKVYEDYSLEKILSLVKAGDANAQYDLSERYYYGKGGVQRDQSKAVKWVKLAAEQNNSGALNSLGFYYDTGQGLKRDTAKAFHYYQLAADQGHRIGIFNTGIYYMMGRGGVRVDTKRAAKLFKKAADLGYIPAKVRLGFAYDEGAGLPQDKKMAFKLYKEAALSGEPNGQYNLATLYYSGKGVAENNKLAIMWFTVSGMNGHRTALHNRAYEYLVDHISGSAISQAEKLAVKCLKSHYKQCEE